MVAAYTKENRQELGVRLQDELGDTVHDLLGSDAEDLLAGVYNRLRSRLEQGEILEEKEVGAYVDACQAVLDEHSQQGVAEQVGLFVEDVERRAREYLSSE